MCGLYEFNSELRGWSYAWRGQRFRGSATHVFAITVLLLQRSSSSPPVVPTSVPKPLWPPNLVTDFRDDSFQPLAYFDSPPFSFGALRDRAELPPSSTPSMSDVKLPDIPIPEGFDPSSIPHALGLPQALFDGLDFSSDTVRRILPEIRLTDAHLIPYVDEDDVLKRLECGLPASSVVSQVISAAADLQALQAHKVRVDNSVQSAEMRADYKAIHDYFYRLRLLQEAFDPDPVRRNILPGNHTASSLTQIPFPYRPGSAFLAHFNQLLSDHPEVEQRQLANDLFTLSLVFPVALEPAIYLLQTLRTPVVLDPHIFSRASTVNISAPQKPFSAFPSDAPGARGEDSALPSRLESQWSLKSLPSASAAMPAAAAGGDLSRLNSLNEPLLSLSSLQSLPSLPPIPSLSNEFPPPAPPPPVNTSGSPNLFNPNNLSPDDSSGAWNILRMVAEYYCQQHAPRGAHIAPPNLPTAPSTTAIEAVSTSESDDEDLIVAPPLKRSKP